MRVIAGYLKGRKLNTIEDRTIRPTSDRVKESFFNIILPYIIDSNFLDLFAGSGAIGIEALSRGASKVSFIDLSNDSIKILRENLKNLKISDGVEVYNTDYKIAIDKFALNNRKFDIIFIDPPYSKGIAQDALIRVENAGIISNDGIVIVEHEEKDIMPDIEGKLMLKSQRKYGSTKLSFYKYDNTIKQ